MLGRHVGTLGAESLCNEVFKSSKFWAKSQIRQNCVDIVG